MGTSTLDPRAKTMAVSTVRHLEAQLFDSEGHLRRGVTKDKAESVIARVNELRFTLGWLSVDLDGHWRWPS